MLTINGKEYKVTSKEIFLGNFNNNGIKGYNLNIQLSFINTDNHKKGYINLDVGFEEEKNIQLFLNKTYEGLPFQEKDNLNIFFEVYDTFDFYDTEISSNILINVGKEEDNQVKTKIKLFDNLIKIEFSDYLNIIEKL